MTIQTLQNAAYELGFAEAALCPADIFSEAKTQVDAQPQLPERRQLRFNPIEDEPRTKSIAVLLWPYMQEVLKEGRSLFVDSYYDASNRAYHAAKALESKLTDEGIFAKANVSYPAKTAAIRAGLGIIGQNGLLIHPRYGTRVVIILMSTGIEFETAPNVRCAVSDCLSCGKCLKACPSGAITEEGMTHPERCLRNFMMEGIVVPIHLRSAMGNRLLGCDMCQRVCPMQPKEEQSEGNWLLDDLVTEDARLFSARVAKLAEQIGKNTARPQRIRAHAALLCGNVGTANDLPTLYAWKNSEFEAVRVHAAWAIEQIESKRRQSQG